MASVTEPVCSLCDKRGLLIMPVRYAIVPHDPGLPVVSAPLMVEDAADSVGKGKRQDLQLKGGAIYTTRLMRSGYLYVYDEKRDRMDGYWVTRDGNFMSFPPEATIPEQAKSATPCDFVGHKELAGCIAISDAEHAGIVWLGFSDVQWTSAVIKAHKGETGKTQRKLHMRSFDAGAWAKAHKALPGLPASSGRGNVPHAVGIGALDTTVAEYAQVAKGAQNRSASFVAPTGSNYRARAGAASAVLEACARRSPRFGAAVVAVDDPSGITQDLAALIQWHLDRLLDTPAPSGKFGNGYGYATTYRNLVALDASLQALKTSNDEKVKLQVFATAEGLADYMKVSYEEAREIRASVATDPALANRPTGPASFGSSRPAAAELARQQAYDQLMRNPSPATVRKAQESSWSEYLGRTVISQPDGPYRNWQKEFANASELVRRDYRTW